LIIYFRRKNALRQWHRGEVTTFVPELSVGWVDPRVGLTRGLGWVVHRCEQLASSRYGAAPRSGVELATIT